MTLITVDDGIIVEVLDGQITILKQPPKEQPPKLIYINRNSPNGQH